MNSILARDIRLTTLAGVALVMAGVSAGCFGSEDVGTADRDTGATSSDTGSASTDGAGGDTGTPDVVDTSVRPDVGPPEPSFDPRELVFENVEKGKKQTAQLVVENRGESPLWIDEIRLHDDVGGDRDEFEIASKTPARPLKVGAVNGFRTIHVTYAPSDHATDRGRVVLVTRTSSTDLLTVPIRTVNAHPDLAGPSVLRFGSVSKGSSEKHEVMVYNRGYDPLRLQNIRIKDDTNFKVAFRRKNPFEVTLQRDDFFRFDVIFDAPDETSRFGSLLIKSNDPDDQPYVIDLTANRPKPCLRVSSDVLDFGEVGSGGSTENLGLLNCSRGRGLTVESVALSSDGGGAFSLEGLPTFPKDIPPAQDLKVAVKAQLQSNRKAQGTLVVRSSDTDRNPLLITLRAERTGP